MNTELSTLNSIIIVVASASGRIGCGNTVTPVEGIVMSQWYSVRLLAVQ